MIKLDYQFKTKTPFHTGSDQDAGIMKTLRRQKIILNEPQKIIANFDSQARKEVITEILYAVYRNIDKDSFSSSRLMNLWSEFHNKMRSAAQSENRFSYLNKICGDFGVKNLSNLEVVDLLDKLTDEELFETIRNESQYILLKVRKRVQDDREKRNAGISDKEIKVPSKLKENTEQIITMLKHHEYVPVISGNSIRGVLRRLVMAEFVKLTEIKAIDKSSYHMLFTGGLLNESSNYEDIEKREQLISMCPALGVLGSAIGNQTITGLMSVGFAYPICKELGTGELSYHQYLDVVSQTRKDDSKTDKDIEIVGEKEGTTQMRYEYEVFAPGTPFNHGFRMVDATELMTSAFWRILELFKEAPIVGGMWATGNAELDLSGLEIPNDAGKLYLDYLKENKEKINDFWSIKLPKQEKDKITNAK